MSKTPTPCIEDGCYETAVNRSRCAEHQQDAFIDNNRRSRLPKDWEARRRAVFARDGDVCHICGEEGADGVDHLEQSMDDDHSLSNLAPVHHNVPPYCHREKTSLEGQAARAGNRPAKFRPFLWQ